METSYSYLRENFAGVLDQVIDTQEAVIVRRRGGGDVVLLPAAELAGLLETAHLLRSPKNAKRLLRALRRAQRGAPNPSTEAMLELRRRLPGRSAGPGGPGGAAHPLL